MGVAVITLPTKACAEAAWDRYTAVCRELQDAPALLFDPVFRSRLQEAERDWLDTYEAWAKRA